MAPVIGRTNTPCASSQVTRSAHQTANRCIPARSGSVAPIRMILKAPVTPGGYRTAWQAFNAAGKAFGDVIYIDIVVQ